MKTLRAAALAALAMCVSVEAQAGAPTLAAIQKVAANLGKGG